MPPRNSRLAADLGSVSCREAEHEETANNQHRETSVTMPMDAETLKELFGGLALTPNLSQAMKFSVPIHELDAIMPAG